MFGHRIPETQTDIVLIGAGVMSATLGSMLKLLEPDLKIEIFETLDAVAAESSAAWNNAGTGHSALCELNYTPEKEDGSVDISKALHITESFEISRQFWAYLVQQGYIKAPQQFIHSVPHMSFVWGEHNVAYLKKRYEAMQAHPFYEKMKYSEDHAQLAQWIPLMMADRNEDQKVAATRIGIGTDVNFGELTRNLFNYLCTQNGVALHLQHEVQHLHKEKDGRWHVKVMNQETGRETELMAKFVFIGAGGGSLPLLEKAHIDEGKGFGGFPVSGEWLVCTNKDVIAQHDAKVYGKASVGAPPMSVPHLDTRIIDGQKALLFGPYAGFSTKFLKHGSWLDLVKSLRADNLLPMIEAGIDNIPLTKYLIDQVKQSDEERFIALKEFVPDAHMEDWDLRVAGQRVQVIKKGDSHRGILEFGTEVVSAADGSLAALLGASPGASTSVSIMLDLIKKCFKDKVQSGSWQTKLKEMIPSYGHNLANEPELLAQMREWTNEVLGLHDAD